MSWEALVQKCEERKLEFLRLYKCLNKQAKLKKETADNHIENLCVEYEAIRLLICDVYTTATAVHQSELRIYLFDLRDKLTRIFGRYQKKSIVPLSIHSGVQKSDDTDSETESDTETEMALEFVNFATKVVPEFDGKPENLQRFFDGLDLMNTQIGTHLQTAISIIKTKLAGNCRSIITNENSIEAVKATLRLKIRGESSENLNTKIMSTKQGSKSINVYAREISELAKNLVGAYTAEGVPPEAAQKYSAKSIVRSVIANASNPEMRIIMKAAQINTIDDAVEKILCSESGSSETILVHTNGRTRQSYRGRGNFYSNNNRGNFNPNYSNSNRNYQNNWNNRQNNGNRGAYNRNFQNRRQTYNQNPSYNQQNFNNQNQNFNNPNFNNQNFNRNQNYNSNQNFQSGYNNQPGQRVRSLTTESGNGAAPQEQTDLRQIQMDLNQIQMN